MKLRRARIENFKKFSPPGMELDFLAFRRSLGPALLHTLPILLLTVLGIAVLGVSAATMKSPEGS